MKSIADISTFELASLASQAAEDAIERALAAGVPVSGLAVDDSGRRIIQALHSDGTLTVTDILDTPTLPAEDRAAASGRRARVK